MLVCAKVHKRCQKISGFSGYYRRFIEGNATFARPLNDLMVGHPKNPEARYKKSAKPTPSI